MRHTTICELLLAHVAIHELDMNHLLLVKYYIWSTCAFLYGAKSLEQNRIVIYVCTILIATVTEHEKNQVDLTGIQKFNQSSFAQSENV